MKSNLFLAGAVLAAGLFSAAGAGATTIAVNNASFETLGSGGLPFGCGVGCSYSTDDVIPGWTAVGGSGLFQPGSSSGNFTYFNYVPDGITVAYTNGGSISQTVSAVAQAGVTYTLMVDVGFRHDFPDPGIVQLDVNGNFVTATGVGVPFSGNWYTYTATYTATAADAGGSISIFLDSVFPQGDWDNVRLTSNAGGVPEPATWAMMLAGFGLAGAALRSTRRNALLAV